VQFYLNNAWQIVWILSRKALLITVNECKLHNSSEKLMELLILIAKAHFESPI